jgi:outer membrane lipoprotein-sorting protein
MMRRSPISIVLALAIFTLCLAPAIARSKRAPDPSSPDFPAYVMERIDDLYRGASSHGVMEMRVKTRHWSRSMTMESWSKGKDYSLMRILRPRKERGTATLKAKNDLFIYLNKTGRTIKITSGMMGGSWMGSHFTNDDLVKHSRMSRDYTIKLTSKDDKVYRFTLQAKPDAPVVWDKLKVTVRRADLQPLRQEYYDEDGRKGRVMTFSEHKKIGGRVVPQKMTMKPTDKPGELTELTLKRIDFDVELSREFFSLQRLKSL